MEDVETIGLNATISGGVWPSEWISERVFVMKNWRKIVVQAH